MIAIDLPPLSNTLGFVALIYYVMSLAPTILRVVFPKTKKNSIPKFLLKHRRAIGILAFVFAFGHGYLLVKKRDIDFFDLKTFWIYIQGVVTFIIFTLLAITSNDWSVKKLKKNWKRLHQLTYWAMFLLIWHIWDKMSGNWTYLTPVGVILITGITILFLVRRWKEWQV
ncbi:ferric reductase-like transmembrane domain-containing protein [Laspinema olomoucense]|uniref:ferric reductase-like transmembrane domain-containing protein n=1 Tax=Laspinema olomoucense TaxID=3231600 RepID=UPI0021BB1503|nr:ferric reductase-like transmembrane domain-containing protein [Laspinema sp. D3a]MCT7991045.1 ferric reductase-like transmembrane domain-containing protein [Laspinema sp. D3a]